MTSTPAPTLDADTLRAQWQRTPGTLLLDVRTESEFESAHIPGSYNVPLARVSEHRDDLSTRLGNNVVLVCRSGARARQAEEILSAQGVTGLRVLEGGMLAWERAGAPVTRGRQTWDLERQVRLAAGSMVASGIIVSSVFPPLKWFSGAIGAGLVLAAVSNTCAMGNALARMPWNRAADHPGLEDLPPGARSDP
ncbi:MAG TPA: rhodanese-like domain-containing protein [Ornithinimicrobium sp.]|uniref:rhodanese-like domain-containing protein n=1 Tax=Ornithinimicrobium sp. TaxID=1977084 RepID=UPI002B480F51|nr:rhodanese-like domain-containing protein [Ornithinimicrobium sp.]HKJ12411.1 rhodanese-like domain-containing protein [Ornithinimicrobium sp.]